MSTRAVFAKSLEYS